MGRSPLASTGALALERKTGTVGIILLLSSIKEGNEFKNDKQGNVHSLVGKLSFGGKKLEENIQYFLKTIRDVKPTGLKGGVAYINTIYVCNAMGPSIRIEA